MKKIKGYRNLTQNEIDLINEVKALGSEIEKLHNKVQAHLSKQESNAAFSEDPNSELNRIVRASPARFASLAKTDFQTALMYLTRAIAQPENF